MTTALRRIFSPLMMLMLITAIGDLHNGCAQFILQDGFDIVDGIHILIGIATVLINYAKDVINITI